MRSPVHEEHESLWRLVAPPSLWAAHFMISYGVGAVWCAKYARPDEPIGPVRGVVTALAVAALFALGVLARSAFRKHRLPGGDSLHAADTPEDRHRFLGYATLLLSGLSALAIVFQSLVVFFVGTCR